MPGKTEVQTSAVICDFDYPHCELPGSTVHSLKNSKHSVTNTQDSRERP